MKALSARQQRGVNLIELIIAIVVISIAATGVLLVYASAVRHSADPMVQQQALAVAEGYLDEILARPVADPRAGVTETGGAEGETRSAFNDVQDYAGISDSPPLNQAGSNDWDADGQPDLPGYSVDVAVLPNQVVNGATMARVDVRVRYGNVVDFTLTGYRAN
ncbi:MAG TPA: prepilin-type N-terminal cleavage/methylation domain-containing protein [Verrucomicrobiae bacterium]|nr:prepilin-type N-terminal cleavage/methylation domain-containing protein [Verrucomicrobiae bacterium]